MRLWGEKRHSKLAVTIIVGVVLALLAIGWYAFVKSHTKLSTDTPMPVVTEQTVVPVAVSSTVLFSGNTYWGRYINQDAMASDLKYAYPFSGLAAFNRDQYDAWVTGLECPTVPNLNLTPAQEEATLSFNCSPDYLPEAAKWFNVVTLANNHTDNQGADGFEETKRQLDKNNIQYFGHYDPDVLADVCDVIALPVKVTYSDKSVKEESLPVAMCGYHGVFKIPSAESIAVMQQYSKYMPVISMPHMGAEYQSSPDSLKQATYRSMIDNGADMVLADHPHWVQSTEAYKGKLIAYSMGNFIFDQQFNSEVTRSGAIKVVMSATDANSDNLAQWLTIGKSCETYHDDCLQRVTSNGLSELPFAYKFSVVGTNNADRITKPATAEQQAAIQDRMNWTTTINGLKAPQSGM